MIEALGDPRFYLIFWLVLGGVWYLVDVRPRAKREKEMIRLLSLLLEKK